MASPPRLSVLTLNCQWGYRSGALSEYLTRTLRSGKYDFLLLQDATPEVRRSLRSPGYSFVLAPANGPRSRACIVYRKRFRPVRSSFLSLQYYARLRMHRGALAATFRYRGADLLVCTVHLYHGARVLTRRKEVARIKEFLAGMGDAALTVIGGDFNCMVPGEPRIIARQMLPEFRHCTQYKGYSHDMLLLEDASVINRLVILLARIFPSRTRLDHIFVSARAPYSSSCAVHDVAVSDHRPVSVELRKNALDTSTRG